MAIITILPLLLSLLWAAYLRYNGWSLAQGIQGFVYILTFSGGLALFLGLMLLLTH